jgi:hypothetical protein
MTSSPSPSVVVDTNRCREVAPDILSFEAKKADMENKPQVMRAGATASHLIAPDFLDGPVNIASYL